MPLTNAEVDAAIPVAGVPSRTLTNAAVKSLIVDVAAKAASGHGHSGLAPAGGLANYVLKKTSGTDYDYAWAVDATTGAATWGTIGGTLSAQADLNAALRIDAPYYTANAMAALAIDTTKAINTKSVNADSSFTFSAVPPNANTLFSLILTNSGATDRTITIPSSRSVVQQSVITSFVLPGNAVIEMIWRYDGTTYHLIGEPVREKFSIAWNLQGTATASTYRIALKMPFGVVIDNVTSICDSGTSTATVKIDAVALGGTANAVSSVEQSQAHSATNIAATGTDLSVTFTAGAVNPSLNISGYRQ